MLPSSFAVPLSTTIMTKDNKDQTKSSTIERFVPQGGASLVDDAPGWGSEEQNQGPTCWKCQGSGWKPQKPAKRDTPPRKRIGCSVCEGSGRLQVKAKMAAMKHRPGVIRKARRRLPSGWQPLLPMAHALQEGNEVAIYRDMVMRADNGEDVVVNQEEFARFGADWEGRPAWMPGKGEELCKLNGHWRILQHAVGHRWTTDDCVTAYYAVRTAMDCFGSDKAIALRYLDLGTVRASFECFAFPWSLY